MDLKYFWVGMRGCSEDGMQLETELREGGS